MRLSARPYRDEEDYWAIRQFLREVYLLNNRTEHSWQVARLDWWRWHGIMNLGHGTLETGVFLWELQSGQPVAVLNREGLGQAFLQVDPRRRSEDLEGEMLSVAETHLSTLSPSSGRRGIVVYAHDTDGLRTGLLERRGYTRLPDWQEIQRSRDLAEPLPAPSVPRGYTLRPMHADDEDLTRRSRASWRAFHADEPSENFEPGGWYANVQRAPLYRRDLDLVAEAPSGEIVAFATLWYDDVTRSGYFEPVGCVPEHRKRGLTKALLLEGMRRIRDMGAVVATAGGGGASNPEAEGLYASVFGKEGASYTAWVKYLDGGA